MTGRVVALHAVRHRTVTQPGDPERVRQIGEADRLPRDHLADGWEARTAKGTFTGYLVDLEVDDAAVAGADA